MLTVPIKILKIQKTYNTFVFKAHSRDSAHVITLIGPNAGGNTAGSQIGQPGPGFPGMFRLVPLLKA